jgi:hypothetical protein
MVRTHARLLRGVCGAKPEDEHIGEDDPDGERLFRDLWEDDTSETWVESLKPDCEVRTGRPPG